MGLQGSLPRTPEHHLTSPLNEESATQSDSVDKSQAAPESGFLRRSLGLTQLRAFASLQRRDYRLLWCGRIFTSMGFWMDQVSRGWLIYELTDSAVQLGLVRGVQAIPILLLSPVAGSAADRYSRKTQILVAQIIDGTMFAALALLIFSGQIQPWHVYVTA